MSDDELTAAMVERGLPEHMHDAVRRYVLEHKRPGHFLLSLFRNDLTAYMRADEQNRACLKGWIHLLYWDLPSGCWGSEAKVDSWLGGPGHSGESTMRHEWEWEGLE